MTEIILGLIAALGVGAGGYFAYRATRRQTSGKVDTTDAATLWAESTAIRKEAVQRAAELQHEVTDLRQRVMELEDKTIAQDREIFKLREENTDSMRVVVALRAEVETLTRRMENGNGALHG